MMRMKLFGLSTMLALAALAVAGAEEPVIEHCYVSLIDDVQVSAPEAGVLSILRDKQGRAWKTDDGQAVQLGMILAQVDDRQPRLELQAAKAELTAALARAEEDIEVRFSEAAYRVAQAEYQAALEVNRKVPGTVPTTEVRRLELTQHRAFLQIDKSKTDQRVAKLQADVNQAAVDAATAAIERRRVCSPVDGIVLAVLKQPGEWVQAGEPVARVARMDSLRVEGFLSAAQYNASELASRPVVVQLELARGRKVELPGRVTFVSPMVQAGNRYRLRAEVENRQENGQWLLRPGMEARMLISLK
jgi:macrolide-specific efflux system membrane fusion protein